MGLFDLFDARKGIAKWADRFFRDSRSRDPRLPDKVIVQLALDARYRLTPLHPKRQAVVDVRRAKANTIHDLCKIVAEAELLHDISNDERLTPGSFGFDLAHKTLAVIETELERLGYKNAETLQREREEERVGALLTGGLKLGQSKHDVLTIMGRRPDNQENVFPEPGKTIERWTFKNTNGQSTVVEFSRLRVSRIKEEQA